MDFELNGEQRLLKDSIDLLIADAYDFEQRKVFAEYPDSIEHQWRIWIARQLPSPRLRSYVALHCGIRG